MSRGYLSPAVEYFENEVLPEAQYPNALSVAIIGGASKGPFELTAVTTKPQLNRIFGNALETDYAVLAAERILKYSNKVFFQRVKSDKAQKATAGTEGTNYFLFETKDFDSTLEGYTIQLKYDQETKTVDYSLAKPGAKTPIEEIRGMSYEETSAQYIVNVINTRSNYVRVEKSGVPIPGTIPVGPAMDTNIVTIPDQSEEWLGKTIGELIEPGAEIKEDGTVVATLKHVTGFSGFNATKPEEQEGYFFPFRLTQKGTQMTFFMNGEQTKTNITFDPDILIRVKPGYTFEVEVDGASAIKINFDRATFENEEVPAVNDEVYTLRGANDGIEGLTAKDYIGENGEVVSKFANVDTVDISTIIVPGVSDREVITAYTALVSNERKDCEYIPDIPNGLTAQEAADWVNGTGGFSDNEKIDTSFVGVYYPWVNVYDDVWKKDIVIPASVAACTQFAYTDSSSAAWLAVAGFSGNRGVIERATGTVLELTKADRDLLYQSGINPVVKFEGMGVVIFGNKTMLRATLEDEDPVYMYMNNRRVSNYIRKILIRAALKILFDPNDSQTWDAFKLEVNPKIRVIKDNRGIADFKVVMDESTITEDDIRNGRAPAIVYVRPNGAIEYIPIQFTMTRDNAIIFDDEDEGLGLSYK